MPAENEDNEATLRLRQTRGETPGPEAARQEPRTPPAPAEANPTSEPKGRPFDQREREP